MSQLRTSDRWLLMALLYVAAATAQLCEAYIPADCGDDTLCHGKDPERYPELFKPTSDKPSRCYCDEGCIVYGDCCLDKAPFPNGGNSTRVWSCVPQSMNLSVYAIANCIHDNGFKQMCEKEFYPPLIGYLLDITVYSNLTGLNYANIFCAFCDPQFVPAVRTETTDCCYKLPKFTVQCNENTTLGMELGQYQNGTLTWKLGNGTCGLFQNEEVTRGRPCVRSVSSCHEDTVRDLSDKCGAYSLLLSDSDKVYRNPHCALCNGINKTNLLCKYRPRVRVMPILKFSSGFEWDLNIHKTPGCIQILNSLYGNCIAISCEIGKGCMIHRCSSSSDPLQQQISHIVEGYLTYLCLSVSAICLLIHVYKSIFVSQLKNIPARVLNSLAWSLLTAQTFFLFGMYSLVEMSADVCYIVSVIIQYFFLASFFWMNVISFDIWYTFSDSFSLISTSYTKYASYAWGGATLCTAFSVIADQTGFISSQYRPHYGSKQNTCWFGSWTGLALFFCYPVLAILILNTIFFIMTIRLFRQQYKSTESLPISGRKDYSVLFLYIKLSTVMGMTWVLGLIISEFVKQTNYHYPFIVLNGLQGTFIFIMFDWKTDVIFLYVKRSLLRFLGKK